MPLYLYSAPVNRSVLISYVLRDGSSITFFAQVFVNAPILVSGSIIEI